MIDELEDIYQQFLHQKNKIPVDMSFKLQFMYDYMQKPHKVPSLPEDDMDAVRDILEIDPKALRLLFISIVKSILSPKMYCSFEKNCKIKMEGYLSRWTNAYITFEDRFSVTFNTFKNKLKFTINHLELQLLNQNEEVLSSSKQKIQGMPQGNNGLSTHLQPSSSPTSSKLLKCREGKPKIQFRYKGLRKLKVKFEHEEAADNLMACISDMQNQLESAPTQEVEDIKVHQIFSEKLFEQYSEHCRNKQVTFRVHKKEPKIHVQIFMKNHFWDILNLVQFLITQKLWNSKIKEEKIQFHESGAYLIERRFHCSNILMDDRRIFTRLKLQKIGENMYHLEENLQPCIPPSKHITISQMHSSMIIQIMAPKIAKISLQAAFNGKGYCRRSDSRSMLTQYFNDFIFLNSKFTKLKEKGKLNYYLDLERVLEDKSCQPTHKSYSILMNGNEKKNQEEQIKNNQLDQDVYYTISEHNNRYGEKYFARSIDFDEKDHEDILEEEDQEQEEVFYDVLGNWGQIDEEDEEQSVDSNKENSNEIQINFKKNKNVNVNNQQRVFSEMQGQSTTKEKQSDKTTERKARKYSNEYSCQDIEEKVKALRPKSYDAKIKLEYLMFLKERAYEKAYLKKVVSEQSLPKFREDIPWYDPAVLLPSQKEYIRNQNNELIFVNQDLIQGQKDSLKFVIKQIGANLISGKSVLNVSLPVDIFESRSLLERSAASFGCAPKYLKPVATADVVTQMKAVIGFMMSVPPLDLIMQKPFNPILGETFQAHIGGIPIYYEQISHHPPISAYYLKCEEFTMHGNLNAVANVSLNSGTGGNAGKMHIIMKNGNHFEISFPPAEISGLIYGQRKYSITNKGFVVQKQNKLVCEISLAKESKGLYEKKKDEKISRGDILGGIFKVNDKFLAQLENEKTLLYFPGLKKADVQEKIAEVRGIWHKEILINKEIINNKITAYELEYFEHVLPSDCNFRLDVMLHRVGDLARSQTEKQVLENVQRNDRKLRQKLAPKK